MTQALAGAIAQTSGAESNLRVGIVQSIDSATSITVNIGGGIITDIPFVSSYSPALGDNVNIARYNATWLAIGIVGSPGLTVINGVVTSSTTTVTTSGTVESDLPFLSSQVPVVVKQGHIYEMFAQTITAQSVATDTFQWRVRRDVAVTGQELGFKRFSNNTITGSWVSWMFAVFEATVDESFDIFWSLVRVLGTGTITAGPTAGTTRAYMKVTDMGLNTTVSGSPWSVTL
jgi:hypothetical protein